MIGVLQKEEFKNFFGSECEANSMTTPQLLSRAQKSWDIYHINLMDYRGEMSDTQTCWKNLLGDHVINTENDAGDDIASIISGIILKSVGTGSESEKMEKEELTDTTTTTTHIR